MQQPVVPQTPTVPATDAAAGGVTGNKNKLCKFIRKGEVCPAGKGCGFSHDLSKFDKHGKLKKTAAAKAKGNAGG